MNKTITSEDLLYRYATDRAMVCHDMSVKLESDIKRTIELMLLGMPDRRCKFNRPVKIWVRTYNDEVVIVDATEVCLGGEVYIKTANDDEYLIYYVLTPSKFAIINGLLEVMNDNRKSNNG